MKQYAEISKGRTQAVCVTRDKFKGKDRLDIRVFFLSDDEQMCPTRQGVNLPISDLPALRAALEAMERDALRGGLLEMEDYESAGLPVPPELSAAA